MKTPEDEAFDDLAKRQGDWGGGFKAKRAMAADKLQAPDRLTLAYQSGFYDGKKAASAQPAQEPERETLKRALEKIATVNAMDYEYQAWARKALAQPEQESVADDFFRMIADRNPKPFPPPQRLWVGLTEEEIAEIRLKSFDSIATNRKVYEAIEVKLKEKNSG